MQWSWFTIEKVLIIRSNAEFNARWRFIHSKHNSFHVKVQIRYFRQLDIKNPLMDSDSTAKHITQKYVSIPSSANDPSDQGRIKSSWKSEETEMYLRGMNSCMIRNLPNKISPSSVSLYLLCENTPRIGFSINGKICGAIKNPISIVAIVWRLCDVRRDSSHLNSSVPLHETTNRVWVCGAAVFTNSFIHIPQTAPVSTSKNLQTAIFACFAAVWDERRTEPKLQNEQHNDWLRWTADCGVCIGGNKGARRQSAQRHADK